MCFTQKYFENIIILLLKTIMAKQVCFISFWECILFCLVIGELSRKSLLKKWNTDQCKSLYSLSRILLGNGIVLSLVTPHYCTAALTGTYMVGKTIKTPTIFFTLSVLCGWNCMEYLCIVRHISLSAQQPPPINCPPALMALALDSKISLNNSLSE